jgi:hypothetical protein
MGSGQRDLASALPDVPEQRERRTNDTGQRLAVGGRDRPLSERDEWQADECPLLDLPCNRLLFGKVARVQPLQALAFPAPVAVMNGLVEFSGSFQLI